MKTYNKTKRQIREYEKLVGFRSIRDKYYDCSERLNDKNINSINSEFMGYCNRVKVDSKIRYNHRNKYEFKWIQEVNELKKKLNK